MTIEKEVLEKYKKFAKIFIETGSHTGKTSEAAFDVGFEKVYTIELSRKWYDHCVGKFANNENVICILGDSVEKLPEILKEINEPAVFWLDGHWSAGDTARGNKDVPLFDELDIIAKHHIKKHILLIDDVRLMGSEEWPNILLEEVKNKCLKINKKYKFSFEDGHVENDILVVKI